MRMTGRRIIIAALVTLGGVQGAMLWIARVRMGREDNPERRVGYLTDARVKTLASSVRRLDLVAGTPVLSSLVPPNSCAVLMFFSSNCAALRSVGRSWGERQSLRTSGGTVPVRWIAILPTDTAAADSARAVASVSGVHWLAREGMASWLGIRMVPRAWVVGPDLRVFGVVVDTGSASSAADSCMRFQQALARDGRRGVTP